MHIWTLNKQQRKTSWLLQHYDEDTFFLIFLKETAPTENLYQYRDRSLSRICILKREQSVLQAWGLCGYMKGPAFM